MTILNQSDPGAAVKARSKHLSGHQPTLFRGQRGRVLQVLREHKGQEVPAYVLARVALQYAARIAELRAAGCIISNRTERHGSTTFGYYTLVSEPGEALAGKEVGTPEAASATLFELGDRGQYGYPD